MTNYTCARKMLHIQFLAAAVAQLGTPELFSRKHLIHSAGSNFMHVRHSVTVQ